MVLKTAHSILIFLFVHLYQSVKPPNYKYRKQCIDRIHDVLEDFLQSL